MKKLLCLSLLVGLGACADEPTSPDAPDLDLLRTAQVATGAPQGAHDYQLLIIGHPNEINDNTDNDWGGNGHRIHVPLNDKTKIMLFEGDFAVLDANATDGEGAFQLPAPGLDAYIVGDPGGADVESDYSVFIRPLGKPGGWAIITTCADLLDSTFGGLLGGHDRNVLNRMEGTAYCSIEQVGNKLENDLRTFRQTGKSTWSNVTAELTTIVFEVEVLDASGNVIDTFLVRVPIFHDALENEYWEYDNKGLRLLQIRFYDCSTNVETGESTCFPD
jgi:hypothetical protein